MCVSTSTPLLGSARFLGYLSTHTENRKRGGLTPDIGACYNTLFCNRLYQTMDQPTSFHDVLPPLEGNPFLALADFEQSSEGVYVRAATVGKAMEWAPRNGTYRTMRKQCRWIHAMDRRDSSRMCTYLEVRDVIKFLHEYEQHGKTRRSVSVRQRLTQTILENADLFAHVAG